uniref:Protein TsetseEP domain-containing protein n=1 Tax=Stomoxys calcitrans TaxID=35570 RepID=A0A1I8Q7W9_STOCA
MSLQKTFIVFTIACMALAMAKTPRFNGILPERSILNFMASSSRTLQGNPTRSLECFDYYIPIIDDTAQQYQWDLGNCTEAFENAQQAAFQASADQRNQLAKTVNDSCAILIECENAATAEDVYQCYINQGPTEAKTLYTVSIDATSQYATLEEKIRQAQSVADMCYNKAKVTYEKDSTQAYAELNSCILNDTPIPTTAAPSTTVSTSSTSEVTDTSSESTPATPSDIKPEEDIFKGFPRFLKF